MDDSIKIFHNFKENLEKIGYKFDYYDEKSDSYLGDKDIIEMVIQALDKHKKEEICKK